ncbi:hypothetical protein PtA15_4A47 [Puccinia triticina]|uniref:Uncharacterized protein n=1 Tax=Puccinia triticina TaxID=208348 RepID=A0ABY7CEW6_9BASI|nr:uncharacterized protein PtA15_4A47 [Puccinia triticina]WAQ83599.1 hypothetical protein PtA15_4A47 [Puccinia triticina]WAR54421.1 hypothetical protein PtB15_4B38 [Puccinia triticina]
MPTLRSTTQPYFPLVKDIYKVVPLPWTQEVPLPADQSTHPNSLWLVRKAGGAMPVFPHHPHHFTIPGNTRAIADIFVEAMQATVYWAVHKTKTNSPAPCLANAPNRGGRPQQHHFKLEFKCPQNGTHIYKYLVVKAGCVPEAPPMDIEALLNSLSKDGAITELDPAPAFVPVGLGGPNPSNQPLRPLSLCPADVLYDGDSDIEVISSNGSGSTPVEPPALENQSVGIQPLANRRTSLAPPTAQDNSMTSKEHSQRIQSLQSSGLRALKRVNKAMRAPKNCKLFAAAATIDIMVRFQEGALELLNMVQEATGSSSRQIR